jgi:hypothetical protein
VRSAFTLAFLLSAPIVGFPQAKTPGAIAIGYVDCRGCAWLDGTGKRIEEGQTISLPAVLRAKPGVISILNVILPDRTSHVCDSRKEQVCELAIKEAAPPGFLDWLLQLVSLRKGVASQSSVPAVTHGSGEIGDLILGIQNGELAFDGEPVPGGKTLRLVLAEPSSPPVSILVTTPPPERVGRTGSDGKPEPIPPGLYHVYLSDDSSRGGPYSLAAVLPEEEAAALRRYLSQALAESDGLQPALRRFVLLHWFQDGQPFRPAHQ